MLADSAGSRDRVRWVITVLAAWTMLAAMLVAASDAWKYDRGVKLILPLVNRQAIRVEVWPLVVLAERFNPRSYDSFVVSFDATNARWVGIWYQDFGAGLTLRLAAFTVPTWPITTLAAVAAIAATTLWLVETRTQARGRTG